MEALGPLSKKLKVVMAGFHQDSPEWHDMALLYTANLKHQYKLIPGAKVTEYYQAYAEADICLVPLVNSPFNRMKSNLKILEAANMGLPVIASGVHPYLDMPVNYCKSSRDWIGHIKMLVQFPKRRQEEGQRLAEFCKENYDFNKINKERRQILEHVAAKTTA
jgi:glycosyltransferase involved in cell wall biosynthesis